MFKYQTDCVVVGIHTYSKELSIRRKTSKLEQLGAILRKKACQDLETNPD